MERKLPRILLVSKNNLNLVQSLMKKHFLSTTNTKCRNERQGFSNEESESSSRPSRELIRTILTPVCPTNTSDLVKYLLENVLFYEQGGVLAVNKPYGMSSVGRRITNDERLFKKRLKINEDWESDHDKSSGAGAGTSPALAVNSVASVLAEHFNEPGLQFAVGTRRNLTGPVLFGCNAEGMDRIRRGLYTGITRPLQDGGIYRALAVAVGRPDEDEGEVEGYITFTDVHGHNEFIFVEEVIKKKKDFLSYRNVRARMRYRVVAAADGCSLIDLTLAKFTRHAPRVILSHLSCPVLGDPIYQRRVARIFDRPVLVDPKSASVGRQYVPRELVRRLGISFSDYIQRLPLFLHVYQLNLPCYGGKNTDLMISAPPPDHFVAMVECLGLSRQATEFLKEECTPKEDDLEGL